jgi:glycosyltransferase involved in cell wall biosynthesis
MRIAHVISRINVGGTARWLQVLTRELQSEGHEVVILTGHVERDELEDPCISSLPLIQLKNLGRDISPLNDLRALHEVRSALRDFEPHVVNTHTAKAGVLGRVATRSLRNRPILVHTIHGHLLHGYFSPLIVRGIIGIEKILSRFTDLVLASGTQVSSDLVKSGSVQLSQLRVVFPGVQDFLKVSREEALTTLGLKDKNVDAGQVIAGWLARIVPVKGPDLLLDVARANPQILFLVGGDGSERIEMESKSPNNVYFTGWTSPEIFWSACDIGILTSKNEAVPYSLIEAALAGIPVIATDVGAVRDAVIHGETGFVTNLDCESMSNHLRCLGSDIDRRQSMGKKGRRRALDLFSPHAMAERHTELYWEAIQMHR